MPYRNKSKNLAENGIYHAYNRGYEKRKVFLDWTDFQKFEEMIYDYFKKGIQVPDIFAYCLMPNHFHFLLLQHEKYDMPRFIKLITGEYTRFFNWKYRKSGQLWQGTYRAVKINNEEQFNNTIAYIHNNPLEIVDDVTKYKFSSLQAYEHNKEIPFIKKVRPWD